MIDHSGLSPIERLHALTAEVNRFAAQVEQRDRGEEEKLSKAAVAGELGPDWKRVMDRVARGETTLEAVFSGQDGSPEAQSLRERSRERGEQVDVAALAEDSDELKDALALLAQQRERVRDSQI